MISKKSFSHQVKYQRNKEYKKVSMFVLKEKVTNNNHNIYNHINTTHHCASFMAALFAQLYLQALSSQLSTTPTMIITPTSG